MVKKNHNLLIKIKADEQRKIKRIAIPAGRSY